MTKFQFDARIEGKNIICALIAPENLVAPIFCFSLLAPPIVKSGGTLLTHTGGYGEVQLPDLAAGKAHEFVLAYADDRFTPVNRAWLPLGNYLRVGDELIELPILPAGVQEIEAVAPAPFEGLRLVPPPTQWHPAKGNLSAGTFRGDQDVLANIDAFAQRTGLGKFLSPQGTPITFSQDETLPPDAYEMEITESGVKVAHNDKAGAHYACISLLVLRATHHDELPCGLIKDQPRFGWRGQHLDCARHFYEAKTIAKLLDLMALLKMNRFHWHFSDDEAFRLEVDCYPQIWQKTAMRGEGQTIPGVFGGGVKAGGSYSKGDASDLVAHAGALHIKILPEIEVPAHALALARVMPHLRDENDVGDEESVQGYAQNVLNPALPETWHFWETLAEEVAEIFPFGIVHLGGDELPENTWAGSPKVDEMKNEFGLRTRDDVQGYTMERLAKHLAQKGIRSGAWEEAARGNNGGIGNDALLFSWTGQGPGIEAAKRGYDVIMCPAQNVYLEMAHTSDQDDWGAAWAAFVSLADTINWNPIPDPAIADRIKGVQGEYWSEFTTKDDQIEPLLAPRILGVATMGWSPQGAISAEELTQLAWSFAPLFEAMEWNWHRNA